MDLREHETLHALSDGTPVAVLVELLDEPEHPGHETFALTARTADGLTPPEWRHSIPVGAFGRTTVAAELEQALACALPEWAGWLTSRASLAALPRRPVTPPVAPDPPRT